MQTEAEAGHGSMPHAAIATNLHDFCLPVRELAQKVTELSRAEDVEVDTIDESQLARLFGMLHDVVGIDFSAYKEATVQRRIARRMAVNGFGEIDRYVDFVAEHPAEAHSLGRDTLIGVTSCCRDPEAWDALVDRALIPMLEARPDLEIFRAWVAGCSTGEEAYSVAIVLKECMEENHIVREMQIFGTDIDGRAVEKAREGE